MPFLQSSGAISIGNLNSFFGGSGTSMSNFYRGGGRVPSTKTVTSIVRDPPSGDYYSRITSNHTVWFGDGALAWFSSADNPNVGWQPPWMQHGGGTSYTAGGFTYYRGSLRDVASDQYGTYYMYAVYRTSQSSSTSNINTGIPSSGSLSLSQFYGAEVP